MDEHATLSIPFNSLGQEYWRMNDYVVSTNTLRQKDSREREYH
jgi:hypothetical protein